MENRRGGSALGRAIREAREKIGLSQRELGQKVGVTGSYVSTIESGAIPTEATARKMAQVLGLPVDGVVTCCAKERLRAEDREAARSRIWPAGFLGVLRHTPFHLEHKAIRLEVTRLVRHWGANRCPRFLWGNFERQLRRLPEVVLAGGPWEIVRAPNGVPGVGYRCYQHHLLTEQAAQVRLPRREDNASAQQPRTERVGAVFEGET